MKACFLSPDSFPKYISTSVLFPSSPDLLFQKTWSKKQSLIALNYASYKNRKRKNNWLNLSLIHAFSTNPYVNELEIKEEKKKKKKTKKQESEQLMIHERQNNRHIPFRYYDVIIAMTTLSLLLLSARLPMTPDPKPILCILKD